MKKIGIALCAAAALLILVNASVWEGAASAAAGGDLPDSGYFAATNSFPRNTVVDVTNLENGRTIRVIVAQGLDTPGLLVILSKDAADAISLPTRSIGRVRMNQPADPVAFARFTEGLSASGDPDHDPEALIAAEGGINPDLLAEASAEATEEAAVEPEPEAIAEEDPELSDAPLVAEADPLASEEDPEDTLSYPPSEFADDGIIPEPGPELVWTYPEEAEPEAEIAEEVPAEPEILAPETLIAVAPEPAEAPGTDVPDSTLNPEAYEFALLPAEERVPPETSTISPLDTIAQIQPVAPPPEREYVIDPSYIIDPIKEAPSESIVIPAPLAAPVYTPPSLPGQNFSVPVIAALEKGKYYLQVAALSKPESVEYEINKIGRTWPIAVQSAGSAEKPMYRLLIGPVNLGESGALLQRFKMNYKDAFVRLGS
ncbi:SPOR domain-containing protein [Leadbettera azotonutricia]|uniref:Putative acidic repeat protein n=1 Tax=Leadbettera azotonutricia (strain ATCC BAA-888 / DSM 13862 / ZAS-9) TaxID=545695 RepID=F5YAX2_LEAAZ|nr:SPOR domain-containing protein [Leadbettera azotonutricia]AEF81167.1 putative acidic repeat protein [Leadbettera azotonutricia ZAS-9]